MAEGEIQKIIKSLSVQPIIVCIYNMCICVIEKKSLSSITIDTLLAILMQLIEIKVSN